MGLVKQYGETWKEAWAREVERLKALIQKDYRPRISDLAQEGTRLRAEVERLKKLNHEVIQDEVEWRNKAAERLAANERLIAGKNTRERRLRQAEASVERLKDQIRRDREDYTDKETYYREMAEKFERERDEALAEVERLKEQYRIAEAARLTLAFQRDPIRNDELEARIQAALEICERADDDHLVDRAAVVAALTGGRE